MEKFEYRAYIKTRAILGITALEISNELKTAHGDQAPAYSTIAKWAKLFREGRDDLEDDPRSGHPITMHTKANIELVKAHIDMDPHATYDEMEAATFINKFTLYQIIHESLKLRKLASRWIPHLLTDENREKRVNACHENLSKFKEGKWRLCDVVTGDESWFNWKQVGRKQSNKSWVAEGESARTVVKQGRFDSKTMVTIFFRTTGPVIIDCMNKGETITARYYIENCLKPLVKELNKQRPTSGTKNIKILHDNAKPHAAEKTISYLNQEDITIIRHPPYSPDLAPCDFWLFDLIKRHLTDHKSTQSLLTQITKIIEDVPREEYKKTFDKWLERMQLCIDNKGHYFEHLIK